MSAEVKEFKKTPNETLILILEDALKEARAGEISSGVLVLSRPKEISYRSSGIEDRFTMIGYLHHMIKKLSED